MNNQSNPLRPQPSRPMAVPSGIAKPRPAPKFAPTDEQLEIIKAVSSNSLMISAYAGTAKSTTLELAAPEIRGPALALAFNKKIATELQTRLPSNFKAQTLNSVGHIAWMRAIDKSSMAPDDKKLGKLITAVARDMKTPLLMWQWDAIRSGVTAAMQAGLSPNDEGEPLIADTPENWESLIDAPSEEDFPFLHTMCWEVLKASNEAARAGQISFDDQIYCPTILGGIWRQYPTVFVDESQDLSPLNHRMLSLSLMRDGLLTAVGDRRQAIYAFRGADSNSMDNMRTLRPQWVDLSLTLTFRCPRVIVDRQQNHAPGYRAAPNNIQGRYVDLDYGWRPWLKPELDMESLFLDDNQPQRSWNWSIIEGMAAEIDAPSGIAILCRNNAPLMSMAFKLIRNGIGCQMLGRDIGRGLINLTNKLEKDDSVSIISFTATLTHWLEREVAIARANQNDARIDKLTDQAECLRATIEGSSPSTVGDLRSVLQRVFSRDTGRVILSSIHRAKGLEWPLVIHLDPWRIPSYQAIQAAEAGDPAPLEQEANLLYVAETRTKHTLVNANVGEFR